MRRYSFYIMIALTLVSLGILVTVGHVYGATHTGKAIYEALVGWRGGTFLRTHRTLGEWTPDFAIKYGNTADKKDEASKSTTHGSDQLATNNVRVEINKYNFIAPASIQRMEFFVDYECNVIIFNSDGQKSFNLPVDSDNLTHASSRQAPDAVRIEIMVHPARQATQFTLSRSTAKMALSSKDPGNI